MTFRNCGLTTEEVKLLSMFKWNGTTGFTINGWII